jgi:hypothetical protein
MWLPIVLHGVSKRTLQWYSKCCFLASVTKTFTLKGVQTIVQQLESINWIIMLLLWTITANVLMLLFSPLKYIFISCGIDIIIIICIKVNKVKFSLCLINYALHHKGLWGNGCIDPRFLDLGTSRSWVVSLMPCPFTPEEITPRYPLNRKLGGPQSRSGRYG